MRTIILNILFELKLRDYSLQISVKNQRCVQIEAFKICGVSKAEKRCLQLIKRVAIIVLLGLSETIAFAKIINLVKSFLKEMAMMWSLFNSVTFPTAMALLVMNKVPVAPLNPGSVHSEVLYSFFSQSIDKAKVKYQYIQNN